MSLMKLVSPISAALLCIGCASSSPTPSAPENQAGTAQNAQVVKSRDGTYTGEVIGKAAPGSKFSKLQIGMSMGEVQEIMGGTPDRFHTYESGKRWIPFYFGNDARRMQVLFKNEGCLIFTDGNAWGGAGGDLVQIEVDPSGACYKP
ncbi:MAG: hypothetical protein K0S28_717 [Paucimonas sp.]|jgi:hypothetical protein|nr:hypothetical protein [Paucimonas sp.]